MNTRIKTIAEWGLRILTAVIMLQTLFFKFSGAPESVYIFSRLGIEPWGRIGTGILELIASLLILIPAATGYGALLGLGIMTGAIVSHITLLGIVVMNDHGQLFIYALLVFIGCLILAVWNRQQVLALLDSYRKMEENR